MPSLRLLLILLVFAACDKQQKSKKITRNFHSDLNGVWVTADYDSVFKATGSHYAATQQTRYIHLISRGNLDRPWEYKLDVNGEDICSMYTTRVFTRANDSCLKFAWNLEAGISLYKVMENVPMLHSLCFGKNGLTGIFRMKKDAPEELVRFVRLDTTTNFDSIRKGIARYECGRLLKGKYTVQDLTSGQQLHHINISEDGQISGWKGIGSFYLFMDRDYNLHEVSGDLIMLSSVGSTLDDEELDSDEESYDPDKTKEGYYYLEKAGGKAFLYRAVSGEGEEERMIKKGKLAYILTKE